MKPPIRGHPKSERKALLRKRTGLENPNNVDFIQNAERTQEANGMKDTRPLDIAMAEVREILI